MADDPKQRLQTQKGITDEIKKQREELSKLIVGSLEYENKLKSVNRLEAQKKKINTIGDLDNIVKLALKSNDRSLLIAIYNNNNQRRYIGVKLN